MIRRHRFERGEAEGLVALRRVDTLQADAVLLVRGVEEGERVAVGDCDDVAARLLRLGERGGGREQQGDEQ